MAEFDHKASLEEWISTRSFSDKRPVELPGKEHIVVVSKRNISAPLFRSKAEEKDRLITNLKIIQDYLCSFKSQGLTVANISATTFPQTLDWLHGYLLQSIEHGISSVSSENVRQQAQN
ncbi:P-LOOP CONTAINING NUCLEOSIDE TRIPHOSPHATE HYDROLASES SUPERFAMILY PROTEIN [Salix purpurea]|uniref:p-LOOP CONTAINING NUCLEOSIDE TRIPHOSPHATE HYDROLASES SUPERFAMILY PROTEIN n=1 Tax=Salix purpurea TaxID=77065 RepID=A0A9Q0TIK4_SALPP|nr:P-LOOP CONTAINING NUCLEOSIDE TRIPHOSPHATE HYDROLASES SUPERFAMILY PROTEIN [Salix purpurea]